MLWILVAIATPVFAEDDLEPMQVDLTNQLGDGWSVRKSGYTYIASRVTPTRGGSDFTKRVAEQRRDVRVTNKDVAVTRAHDEITLRGRVSDCVDGVVLAQQFAGVEGINKIYVDLSCAR